MGCIQSKSDRRRHSRRRRSTDHDDDHDGRHTCSASSSTSEKHRHDRHARRHSRDSRTRVNPLMGDAGRARRHSAANSSGSKGAASLSTTAFSSTADARRQMSRRPSNDAPQLGDSSSSRSHADDSQQKKQEGDASEGTAERRHSNGGDDEGLLMVQIHRPAGPRHFLRVESATNAASSQQQEPQPKQDSQFLPRPPTGQTSSAGTTGSAGEESGHAATGGNRTSSATTWTTTATASPTTPQQAGQAAADTSGRDQRRLSGGVGVSQPPSVQQTAAASTTSNQSNFAIPLASQSNDNSISVLHSQSQASLSAPSGLQGQNPFSTSSSHLRVPVSRVSSGDKDAGKEFGSGSKSSRKELFGSGSLSDRRKIANVFGGGIFATAAEAGGGPLQPPTVTAGQQQYHHDEWNVTGGGGGGGASAVATSGNSGGGSNARQQQMLDLLHTSRGLFNPASDGADDQNPLHFLQAPQHSSHHHPQYSPQPSPSGRRSTHVVRPAAHSGMFRETRASSATAAMFSDGRPPPSTGTASDQLIPTVNLMSSGPPSSLDGTTHHASARRTDSFPGTGNGEAAPADHQSAAVPEQQQPPASLPIPFVIGTTGNGREEDQRRHQAERTGEFRDGGNARTGVSRTLNGTATSDVTGAVVHSLPEDHAQQQRSAVVEQQVGDHRSADRTCGEGDYPASGGGGRASKTASSSGGNHGVSLMQPPAQTSEDHPQISSNGNQDGELDDQPPQTIDVDGVQQRNSATHGSLLHQPASNCSSTTAATISGLAVATTSSGVATGTTTGTSSGGGGSSGTTQYTVSSDDTRKSSTERIVVYVDGSLNTESPRARPMASATTTDHHEEQ